MSKFNHLAPDIEKLMWDRADEQGRQLLAGGLTYDERCNLPPNGILASDPRRRLSPPTGLVASGGICAPVNTDYSVPTWIEMRRVNHGDGIAGMLTWEST